MEEYLDIDKVSVVIHGAASGADQMASHWARVNHIKEIACPANWKEHGKAAGPIRNQQMLDNYKPHLVIAFPGGRGTADTIRRATQANIPCIQIKH